VTSVQVNASKCYEIMIDHGLLDKAGQYIKNAAGGSKTAVITDDTVGRLYGQRVINSLEKEGYQVFKLVFPHGEKSKNAVNFIKTLNFLANNGFSRKDVVVALGGGVIGDLAGFAAASYMRGIKLVQIPTTLLSAVDSSVGGKTAIDLDAGKNLAGAFYQPELVICDYTTLATLNTETLNAGCAEVIKYGVICDKELFENLKSPLDTQIEEIIARCVTIKRDIVIQDERDTGIRNILNFGHTIGHAVELCSGYEISHGFAVAIGMAAMARAAEKNGYCSIDCRDAIIQMLKRFSLPTETKFKAEELYNAALSDKKNEGNIITVIIPREIGKCELKKITMSELKEIIELGVSK
jgi:3-dehydroquinate synthase